MIPLSDARVATLRADLRAIGGSTCARLLRRCVELLEDATADAESARATECASTAAILTDAAWEKLHTGDWKDAEPAWRDLYALATLLRVRASAIAASSRASSATASATRFSSVSKSPSPAAAAGAPAADDFVFAPVDDPTDFAHGAPSDGMECMATMEAITEEDKNY